MNISLIDIFVEKALNQPDDALERVFNELMQSCCMTGDDNAVQFMASHYEILIKAGEAARLAPDALKDILSDLPED